MLAAFRVDASVQIGIGHFMRCLTLADALHAHGAEIIFISRYLPDHLQNVLETRGYPVQLLRSVPVSQPADKLAHAAWLGTSQSADVKDSIKALSGIKPDWFVVDHYALDSTWESSIRTISKRVMVIDDIADRQHDCDILLDQNLFHDMNTRYSARVSGQCKLLLGPGFALLREEFSHYRDSVASRDGAVHRILVSMGGIDAGNLTEVAMTAIAGLQYPRIAVDVVIGQKHPARAAIQEKCQALGYQCHVEVSNMAELMSKADLAIGSSGATSWERCCLGLPTICLIQADNQIAIAAGLEAQGAVVNLGIGTEVDSFALTRLISDLIKQPNILKTMSDASSRLVDGKGSERVCQSMFEAL